MRQLGSGVQHILQAQLLGALYAWLARVNWLLSFSGLDMNVCAQIALICRECQWVKGLMMTSAAPKMCGRVISYFAHLGRH